jgi:hypothetical protein
VIIFRIGIALLQQLLLLLLLGARLDLLVAEILQRRRRMTHEAGSDSSRSSRMIAFAALVLVESLAIDLLILSQLRMH